MFLVIVENDESQWSDDTGVLYHFPKRYEKLLKPGANVVYYKGKIKNKKYIDFRMSAEAHYFGVAKIGNVYLDKQSTKGDLFALIDNYRAFDLPVLAKTKSGYLEHIPENKKTNYWRDGVRVIDENTFYNIVNILPSSGISDSKQTYQLGKYSTVLADELESYPEGEKKLKFTTLYERNPKLRRIAIAIHGTNCFACGFNFGYFYGEYAEGFIHIHHIVPISEYGGTQVVNPATDLVPLCANCHSVVHRKKDKTLTLNELQQKIQSASPKI